MKLKSFGCSFIFGTDLADSPETTPVASKLTWPALIAKQQGWEYQCWAKGGAGNLFILDVVLQRALLDPDTFVVVGWTWIDRFDYGGDKSDSRGWWETLGPNTNTAVANTYYKHLHTEYRDKLTALAYINTVINFLTANNVPFLMTHMDDLLFDRQYNTSTATLKLQEQIRPHVQDFQGQTFLNWSQQQGFEISPTLHPLEPAHSAAADVMLPQVQAIMHNHKRV
jgi:hypothetical protein